MILPIMILIAIAVGDFGRIYATIVTLESAVREAADYGAFKESHWDPADPTYPANRDAALAEMLRRACTSASTVPGYSSPDGNVTCSNPVFEFDPDSEMTDAGIPIIVARATFTFSTALSFPPLPDSVTLVREARFAVSDLPQPPAP